MKKTFENLEEGDVVYIVRKNGYTVTEVCQRYYPTIARSRNGRTSGKRKT